MRQQNYGKDILLVVVKFIFFAPQEADEINQKDIGMFHLNSLYNAHLITN